MSQSLNEIEALVKRAARGSGMHWGLAEEAGKCARWLASFDLPASPLFVDLFALYDNASTAPHAPQSINGNWSAASGSLCPITAGSTLCDCSAVLSRGGEFQLENIAYPLLILPFVAGAAKQQGITVLVEWGQVTLVTDGFGLFLQGADTDFATNFTGSLRCFSTEKSYSLIFPTVRGKFDDGSLEKLTSFAKRSFAPATEASRKMGAGSGNSDND